MPTGIPPTAEGDLGRTPLAHLLVYVLDKQLTGALLLREASGITHRLRLLEGAVVKVLPGDNHARLGEMLIDDGHIDAATLEGALSMRGLLGDALLLAGCIEREVLEKTAERQFMRRMAALFSLGADTRYGYFDGREDLADNAGPNANVHPLALIWNGMREHAAHSTMMETTLSRLDETSLLLHPNACLEHLAATPEEMGILERLTRSKASLHTLVCSGLAPETTVRAMVYTLVIMRYLELGLGTQPLCARQPSAAPNPPPSAEPNPAATTDPTAAGANTVTLARIRLRSASHRLGAAAPDQAGDGERVRAQPRPRKRGRPSQLMLASRRIDTPPPSEAVAEPPQSAVVETDPARANIPNTTKPVETQTNDTPSSDADKPPAAPTLPEGRPDAAQPAHALYKLAVARLSQGDLAGSLAACQLAREVDTAQPDYAALAIWIRSLLGGADLAERVAELDTLLAGREDHVQALFYRGYLRRRIGDEAGAENDLRRTLTLAPDHADAARELRRLEMRKPARRPSGLFRK